MKKQILSIAIVLTIIMVNYVLAVEIVSNTLTISVDNNSITIYNPYRPTDNNTFFFSTSIVNNSNYTYINPQNFTFTDLFVNNGTYKVLDIDLNSKLLDCISLSSQLNTSLLNCQLTATQLGNTTSQLNICQLDRRDRDNTISNLQKENADLNAKVTGTSNNGIIWGLVGAGVVAIGFVFYIRTKNGEGVASKIDKEFSRLGAT